MEWKWPSTFEDLFMYFLLLLCGQFGKMREPVCITWFFFFIQPDHADFVVRKMLVRCTYKFRMSFGNATGCDRPDACIWPVLWTRVPEKAAPRKRKKTTGNRDCVCIKRVVSLLFVRVGDIVRRVGVYMPHYGAIQRETRTTPGYGVNRTLRVVPHALYYGFVLIPHTRGHFLFPLIRENTRWHFLMPPSSTFTSRRPGPSEQYFMGFIDCTNRAIGSKTSNAMDRENLSYYLWLQPRWTRPSRV